MLERCLQENVKLALAEDIGSGDITSALVPNTPIVGKIKCRQLAVLCGIAWVNEVFRQLDPSIQIQWFFKDGDEIAPNTILCEIKGPARPILSGERTALNFLQTLSGTATATRHWARLIAHTPCQLLDTRKTLPGLRLAQKYAVRVGGGVNHRLGLYDVYLIKENHIAAAGGITQVIAQARTQHPDKFLVIEVRTLAEYEEAVKAQPDRILLDNFNMDTIKQAIAYPHDGISLEVSGGVSESQLITYAEMGIDCISVGALTKNLQAIDLSMLISK